MMKNNRLFQLVYLLMEKGVQTAPQLAALLEVSVRTVYRDVEALAMAGVPVCTAQGKGGGISLMAGFTINRALFTEAEQNQILFALQSLRAVDQTDERLLSKLSGLFRRQHTSWIAVDFSRWGYGRVDQQRFDTLKEAILDRRLLQITYCGASGEQTQREVKPLKLIFKARGWYLLAYCLKAEDYRLFKINRMVSLLLTEQHFADLPDAAPPLPDDWESPENLQMVALLFSPAAAYRVYDEFTPDAIERRPDGSLLVRTAFPPDESIIAYLLTYGTALRVLEPQALRSRIADFLQKIRMHYET